MRIHLCFAFWAKQHLHFNNDRTWLGNCKNSCEHICNKERTVSFFTTNACFPLWKSHVFQDLKLLQYGSWLQEFPFSISFTLRRNSTVIYFCIKLNVIQWYTGKDKVEERKDQIYTYMDHICHIYTYDIFQVKQIRSLLKITSVRQIGWQNSTDRRLCIPLFTILINCVPAVLWFFALCLLFSIPPVMVLCWPLSSTMTLSSSASTANPELSVWGNEIWSWLHIFISWQAP